MKKFAILCSTASSILCLALLLPVSSHAEENAAEVLAVLHQRFDLSGLAEKAARNESGT